MKIRFPIFKCKWVNVNNGVRIDQLGFILVDISSRSFGDEPFYYGRPDETSVLYH